MKRDTEETCQSDSIVCDILLLTKKNDLIFFALLILRDQLFSKCNPNHSQSYDNNFPSGCHCSECGDRFSTEDVGLKKTERSLHVRLTDPPGGIQFRIFIFAAGASPSGNTKIVLPDILSGKDFRDNVVTETNVSAVWIKINAKKQKEGESTALWAGISPIDAGKIR